MDPAEPALQPGEVRIRVAYCGICGSDLHEYVNGPHAIPVERPHALSGRCAPLTLGHEFCGEVVESADSGVRVGARVAVEPEYRCGQCTYCRKASTTGASPWALSASWATEPWRKPWSCLHTWCTSFQTKCASIRPTLEPAAVALHAVRSSGLRPGDACAVFGMGPIGLLTVAMLRQCGAGEIIAVDVHPSRLALAGAMGASRTVDASREHSASTVFAATSGQGAAIAFEAAGSQLTLDATLACLRKGGEAVLVGLMGKAEVDIFDIVNRELRLTASVGYRDVFPTLMAWTARGLIDPSAIVMKKVSLAHAVPQGFDALIADKDQVKVLVAPNGEDVG